MAENQLGAEVDFSRQRCDLLDQVRFDVKRSWDPMLEGRIWRRRTGSRANQFRTLLWVRLRWRDL